MIEADKSQKGEDEFQGGIDVKVNTQAKPKPKAVFKELTELNFSFNIVEEEEGLIYPVAQFPKLNLLIVTGNPFSMRGDPFQCYALENLMKRKTRGQGKILNETLNPPTYLRRQKSKRTDTAPLALPSSAGTSNPMMLNYFPSSNRELVVVSDHHNTKFNQKFYHPDEEEDLFPGQQDNTEDELQEDIKAIENGEYEKKEQQREQTKNDNKFFITEDEMIRGGGE